MADLSRLANPRVVAIVGASATPGSPGHSAVRNVLRHSRVTGSVYLINPSRDEIEGHPCLRSLDELPADEVDTAMIVVPAASVVAVPSYNESFGLVAAEAQAAGTPVVAAAVGGLTTVVADAESGLLLDSHEPDDWAHALGRVLLDDGLRSRLAAGARVRAGEFSWEDTAERTLAVYERARAALRQMV